jgi:hypothetical protein
LGDLFDVIPALGSIARGLFIGGSTWLLRARGARLGDDDVAALKCSADRCSRVAHAGAVLRFLRELRCLTLQP